MIDEKKFKELSEYVYWLDKNNKSYDADYKEGAILEGKNSTYKVIKIEDNITNGMQANAVALVKNNIVDTSEIIIAYAGTNSGDNLDFQTDIQTVIGGIYRIICSNRKMLDLMGQIPIKIHQSKP